MENEEKKYIGTGWSFPVGTDSAGKVKLVTGNDDIEQAIHIILETSPGERVMRPLFGCRAKEMVFDSIRPETMTLMSDAVKDALTMWEPRIFVRNVLVERDLRTRAYENMLAVATCNYPKGHPDCNGHSTLFDGVPWLPDEPGVRDMCVFEAPEEEGIYLAELDLDQLRNHRQDDVMGDKYRRPDVYGILR